MSTVDVVVIGAGVLGASAAYRLAEKGFSVEVLERGAPNREGSGTTAGNLHIQAIHTRRPGQAVPVDSRRFLPLQKAASDRWSTVEAELGEELEVRRPGGFMVAETEDDLDQLTTKAVWEREVGIKTEILDGDTARAELPVLGPSVRAATWCPDDGYANPLLAGPAWLRAGMRLGVQLSPGTPVTGLERRGEGWEVTTPTGTTSCRWVVNTAGPWIQPLTALAGVELRMRPVAIQMHVTVRVPPLLPCLVQHIGRGLSVKQVTAGNVLIGGGWPAESLDLDARSHASLHSMAGNLAEAIRILPPLSRLSLLRMWAGPLAATPDEMPVIGAVPGADGLLVAGGTYAFTFAPLWADVLAAAVLGEPSPIDVRDLGPDRLIMGAK
ncbi:NAD(P)/FAD-dependent oxidoreductase [Kineosporia babensis]|uniref:FAD-binding oxidoreductase n=1 Tax=Kineosporia babensis TaxID=499548 RepID=A0A9X1SSM7_9ACTN|nr:FAD-binding oxidoreductase [Kineosporia babensis]MCD5310749.1 FAD-binding oxidoreductase [Kineosporia babensis]